MNWDTIKDYMNSFLGAFFLFLSIIVIPEIRKSKKYWIPLSTLTLFLLILGVDKINRDNREKDIIKKERTDSKNKIDSMINKITDLSTILNNLYEGRKNDSVTFVEFTKNLETKYNIYRDPKTNLPVNYNVHINKADKVHIGPGDN